MADDPFAELDDILGQIENKQAASAKNTLTPSSSGSSQTKTVPTQTQSKSELDSLLDDLETLKLPVRSASSNSKPISNSSSGSAKTELNTKTIEKYSSTNTDSHSNANRAPISPRPVTEAPKQNNDRIATGSTPQQNVSKPPANPPSKPAVNPSPSSDNQTRNTNMTATATAAPVRTGPSAPTVNTPVKNSTPAPATTQQPNPVPVKTTTPAPPAFTPTFPLNVTNPIVLDSGYSLNLEETKLIAEINQARSRPQDYAEILKRDRRPFFEGKNLRLPGTKSFLQTEEGVSAVDEAIQFLMSAKPLSPFRVAKGMCRAASDAVRDIGSSGQFIASESINKLDDYGTFEVEAVELVSFGSSDAREVVLRFLVGDGNGDRTHRGYIFNADYKCIGLSVGEHNSAFKMMACVNFSNGYKDGV